MRDFWIWITALVFYGAFSLWYNNFFGPLTTAEIDTYLDRLKDSGGGSARLATVRAFLETDDGGEFFMLNLIRLHDGPVTMPASDETRPAQRVLEVYTNHFMPGLFLRAGHPTFVGPTAGSYVEHWGVEPDPGWTFAGVIRYRCRRDLMELATDPAFDSAHAYKIAAMANTFAFPVGPALVFFGPRVWVALVLGLVAALAHLIVLLRRVRIMTPFS